MKIHREDLRARKEKEDVNFGQLPTDLGPFYKSKMHYKERLQDHIAQLSVLQQLHYASGRYAVLLQEKMARSGT